MPGYDPLERELHYKSPLNKMELNRGDDNLSVVRISEDNSGMFFSTGSIDLRLFGAGLSVFDDDRGLLLLRSADNLRDRLGYRYTLFSAHLHDVKVQSISGPHLRFSAWATDPFNFYPTDWDRKPELVNGGDEEHPPQVFAPNLPNVGRPIRLSIAVFFKSEEWEVDGL